MIRSSNLRELKRKQQQEMKQALRDLRTAVCGVRALAETLQSREENNGEDYQCYRLIVGGMKKIESHMKEVIVIISSKE